MDDRDVFASGYLSITVGFMLIAVGMVLRMHGWG
jgi:uncharacterized membrane protein